MYKNLTDFYRSKEWTLLSVRLRHERADDEGVVICAHCGKPIVRAYDCIAHHTVELTERNINDVDISLNSDLIQLVHHRCHNQIHDKLGRIRQDVYLVWGAPLSGKTTWVDEVREPGDLIVDMDLIWMMVSGCPKYVKPDRLKGVAFSVRDKLLECVEHRIGTWKHAYVVGGYPLVSERERLMKRLGAKEIYVECSKEECLGRLKKDALRGNEWARYIDDWWRICPPPPQG